MKIRKRSQRIAGQAFLAFACLLAAFPLFWIVLSSFKREVDALGSVANAFVFVPTIENYAELFRSAEFLRAATATIVITASTTVLVMVVAILAAYGLARMHVPARRLFVTVLVLVQVVPVIALLIPLYRMASALGLYDQWITVILVQAGLHVPFATWLMLAFLRAVPLDVEEAATLDGANRLQLFRHVLLPMLRPGIVAASILTAIGAWNSFIIPVILGQSRTLTLTAYITKFLSQDQLHWAAMSAAAVLIMAPIVIFVVFMQKSLLAGMTAGRMKF
ncbi:MAG: carbohydrate ABC transporter permease [Microbacterium sp.]